MEWLIFTKSILGSLYIAACLICLLFYTLLFKSNFSFRRFLMTFLVVKVGIIICEWFVLHTDSPANWFWLSLLIILSFSLAPLLYRFAQHITEGSTSRRFLYWEWVIGGLALLLMIPLFLASQVFFEFDVQPWFGHTIHITMSMCILLFAIQVAYYWLRASSIYRAEIAHIKTFSSSLQHASLRILRVLLVLVFSHWAVGLIRSLNVWFWHSQMDIVIVSVLIEYCVLLAGMFFMFHGSIPIYQNQTSQGEAAKTPQTKQYAKTPLTEAHKKRIADKLLNENLVTPLVCANDISLHKFADALGEKPYYVSQVFSQNLDTNFYEYVTDLRIKTVVKLLSTPSQMSILTIALSVGFNSKSTFNSAFKARVGLTPSKFRANQKLGKQVQTS